LQGISPTPHNYSIIVKWDKTDNAVFLSADELLKQCQMEERVFKVQLTMYGALEEQMCSLPVTTKAMYDAC